MNYLHRFGLDESPDYIKCATTSEDPDYFIFHYPRFADENERLNEAFNVFIGDNKLVEEIQRSQM